MPETGTTPSAADAREMIRIMRESACGSKALERPLSRFPLRGKAGAGGFPPRRWHAVRQQKALAHIDAAAPPARGVSKRSAETPLAHPPDGRHRGRVQMVSRDLPRKKNLRMAATSALTFTTFS